MFVKVYLVKINPLFVGSILLHFKKNQNFFWICLLLAKNLPNFLSPILKLHNQLPYILYSVAVLHRSWLQNKLFSLIDLLPKWRLNFSSNQHVLLVLNSIAGLWSKMHLLICKALLFQIRTFKWFLGKL